MSSPAPIWLAPTEPRCLDNSACNRNSYCARALVAYTPGRPVIAGSSLLYGTSACAQFLDAASHRHAPVVERKAHESRPGLMV